MMKGNKNEKENLYFNNYNINALLEQLWIGK